jgi:hypothetical protein
MLTKSIAVIAMIGALWVAHDSLHREFGCHSHRCPQISASSECCSTGVDCCGVSRSACCAQASREPLFVYCASTQEVHFVERVDGKFRCMATGALLDECCCTPVDELISTSNDSSKRP